MTPNVINDHRARLNKGLAEAELAVAAHKTAAILFDAGIKTGRIRYRWRDGTDSDESAHSPPHVDAEQAVMNLYYRCMFFGYEGNRGSLHAAATRAAILPPGDAP